MKCPSCQSERCGNHAACARRHEAAARWRAEWIQAWATIGVAAHVVIRVQAEHPEATPDQVLRVWMQKEQERQAREALASLFFGGRLR